jgi:hypothetical protein
MNDQDLNSGRLAMMKSSGLAVACAMVLLSACGGSDKSTGPNPVTDEDTFTATISGGVQSSYDGVAVFGENSAQAAFALSLSDSTKGTIVFVQQSGTAGGTGSQAIFDAFDGSDVPENALVAAILDGPTANPTGAFVSTGGTLTITERSATTIKGSFHVTAAGALIGSEDQVEITVDGSFTAKGGTVNVPSYTVHRRVVARR